MPRSSICCARRCTNRCRARVVVAAVGLDELLPLRALGLLDEGEQLGRVEAERRVEVLPPLGSVPTCRPGSHRRRRGEPLISSSSSFSLTELMLPPGMSSWPVTAAVMRAWRRSRAGRSARSDALASRVDLRSTAESLPTIAVCSSRRERHSELDDAPAS